VFHRDLGRRYGPDRPQDKGIQPGRHQRLARPWERRRPRRHLLNGRRPHPSRPRHDHPNRPLGGGRSTPADETSAFPGNWL
jgi:hypothetical protein